MKPLNLYRVSDELRSGLFQKSEAIGMQSYKLIAFPIYSELEIIVNFINSQLSHIFN